MNDKKKESENNKADMVMKGDRLGELAGIGSRNRLGIMMKEGQEKQ